MAARIVMWPNWRPGSNGGTRFTCSPIHSTIPTLKAWFIITFQRSGRTACRRVLSFILPATILARGEFDIVHSQGLCGLSHNFATADMCQPAWYKALANEGNRFNWKHQVYRTLVARLERRALCQSTTRRVVAVSNRLKADLAEHYGRSEQVDVVYHGTDVETFHPENRDRFGAEARDSLGIPRGAFTALYVGDLKKGAAAAIKAVAMAPGVHLVVLTASNFKLVERVAHAEGVADRVLLRPHTRNVDAVSRRRTSSSSPPSMTRLEW